MALSVLAPNLLVAAGTGGEVLVYDVASAAAGAGPGGDATVALYAPAPGAGAQAEALSVQFNNQNAKIVAIGYSNGHTHVRSGQGSVACAHLAPRVWLPRTHARSTQHAFPHSTTLPQVYDFRSRKKFLAIRDDVSPRRTAALAWSPVRDTHLVLASADDRSPTLQHWDLRKASSPTLEFVGHSRGVTDVAWCPHDAGVMISCGKDCR